MTQLDKLTRHFPLRHDTLVPQATDPLGEEVVALAMRADIMYGKSGMSVPQLKEFIRQHLESLSAAQRKTLAERIPFRRRLRKFRQENRERKGISQGTARQ